jgi:flavorubredoxin
LDYFQTLAPGIILVGHFGWLKTGIWLLFHNKECMILEMPDFEPDENVKPIPWLLIQDYIQKEQLILKFMTCTHAHMDHVDSFKQFHNVFPDVPIIWHESFFKWGSYFGQKPLKKVYNENFMKNNNFLLDKNSVSIEHQNIPIYCWQGDFMETNLGGEVIYIVYVPKHSSSDTMIIFQGTMITGDWWWGPGDPNNNHINVDVINQSIDRLENFSTMKKYHIKNMFSVHANEFHRDLTDKDYLSLLESTRPKK